MTRHLLLWAKSARTSEDTGYHPLTCHLVDAAMVACCLWDSVLTPAIKHSLSASMRLDESAARDWVVLLSALHDLGKATPVFQMRNDAMRRRLADSGFRFPPMVSDPGHGRTGAALIEPLLTDRFGWPQRGATQVAIAVGGHHGRFPGDQEFLDAGQYRYLGDRKWDAVRTELVDNLIRLLDFKPSTPPQELTHAGGMILAGLVSVSDWIASDERFFSYAAPTVDGLVHRFDLHDYLAHARRTAWDALNALGWLDWSPDESELAFADLFPPIGASPRPVQQRIVNLPGIDKRPGIVIVELPMGEGKTEAAFYLADHWGRILGQRGAYIAMPTMATANQMFSRASAFLTHRYPGLPVNVQLLHSHAALESGDDAEATEPPPVQPAETYPDDRDEPVERATARAGEWFTRRKRGLLAPFGVGTVDQSFLAALQTRHVFVRLFGLAGKTVIFDEVHAYDAYMERLFERLLGWLGALGSSVIILSATLPDNRRAALLAAYARGRDGDDPETIHAAAYPRISWLGDEGAMAESVDVSTNSRRELGIEWLDSDASAVGAYLHDALWDGGCAAVVCNTVGRAQEVYQALKSYFRGVADDGQPELDLFHARYPYRERLRREQRTLIRFGKPCGSVDLHDGQSVPVRRPQRAVLVATQVVEQSLDLDFDLMLSDLAPIDLLLQRSGRLHRHHRPDQRPNHLSGQPILRIVSPDTPDGVPAFSNADRYIYDEHVLLRTWLALRGVSVARIPEDVGPLIEAVYDEREPPLHLDVSLTTTWHATHIAYERRLDEDQREAEHRWIKSPHHTGLINRVVSDPRADDEPDLHPAHQALTRLGEPTVSMICLHGTSGNPALDPDGQRSVSLSGVPDFPVIQELLRRSVTISDRRIVTQLLEKGAPSSWQRSALLRHHRPVVFDAHGFAIGLPVRLRLDPELGLYVEREGVRPE